jgi:NAD(P)-dependent dehydrogenase (short-subunit alcohol dehydrogenase family)
MNDPRPQRVAMISGSNRGIGLAMARQLKSQGIRLSLGIRSPTAFDTQASLGVDKDCAVFPYEAGDREAGKSWVAATLERFGRIDILINAAGVMRRVSLADGTEEDLDALLEINLKAPFRLIQAALPHLRVSGCGRVITVASLSGKRVRNDNAGYQMSKFGLVALSHAVRSAAFEDGVRALALCPGYVKTDMTRDVTAVPRDQMTNAEDLARLVGLIIDLPNTASISELLVNCSYEAML